MDREEGSTNMFKMRIALLGAMTLLVVSGFAASTASALVPSWKVNGQKLGAQVKKQIKLTAAESKLKGEVAGFPTTIACTSVVVENGYIEGSKTGAGQGGATGMVFKNCTVTEITNCKVEEPIVTHQIKEHLVTYGEGQGKIGAIFEPSQGTEFVSLKFLSKSETEKCALNGQVFPVKGSVAGETIALGQEQKQEPLESVIGSLVLPSARIKKVKLEGQEKTVELNIGSNPAATFATKFGAQLVLAEPFGVFQG
jgi:hypothetical protein